VLALARDELGVAAPPAALEALKFRSPLLPEREFELRVEARHEQLRFELGEGANAVSSGRLRLDPALAQHRPQSESSRTDSTTRLPLRLPHAGRMRLLERVLFHAASVSVCEALVTSDTPLCESGRAPSWLALELLAQGMAAHGGLARLDAPREVRGLLVGARRVELRTRGFAAGERLWVRAEQQHGAAGLVAFECALGTGAPPRDAADARARALAAGSLSAFVAARPA
jgi:predicted hotdog family 3-hydroxylacyl-ACP dehydratase